MATRIWYKPDHRSFGAFIRSDKMRDVTAEVARDIAAMASAAPDVVSEDEPSDLIAGVRKGFRVKRNAGNLTVGGNLRVVVEVENKADGAALVEFGARNIRRRRALGSAGAAFGDFKPEGGPT